MYKMLALSCTAAALLAFNGCTQIEKACDLGEYCIDEMTLSEQPQPRIQSIVEQHKQNVNRAQELDILCGKVWIPVYIKGQEGVDGKNAITLPQDVQAYIEFHRDGRLSGFAGVNVFDGSFAVTAPNLLRFGAIATSLQAGPHLDYEMLMMAQLKDVDHFELLPSGEIEFKKRNMLMIRCKGVDPATVSRKVPKASTPVPPEPASTVAPAGANSAPANPALPTVK